jgi:Flp pilus assembly protein protease CpaA
LAGPAATPPLLVLTGLFGGLLCVFVLTPLGQIAMAASGQAVLDGTGGAASDKRPAVVPYGAAIAAAALIVTIPPNFS